jgi:hypothetical protein
VESRDSYFALLFSSRTWRLSFAAFAVKAFNRKERKARKGREVGSRQQLS